MTGASSPSRQAGRIARLLGLEQGDLPDLSSVPEEDLVVLHDQISRTLFAEAQQRFVRIAGLSKTLPAPVAGRLAEMFLPPVMAARVSELLDPDRARDLVGRVSVRYLADLAMALDPVRSRPVVQALPAARIGDVARELFGRGEYAVMAEFANTVTVDALLAALAAAAPHDLLALVPLLEWNAHLDDVVARLPDEQVADIVDALDARELAELALALDPSRFGPIVGQLDDEVVAAIAAELVARGEHAAMARFAVVVTRGQLTAVVAGLPAAHLLALLPHLEWNADLDAVVAELDQDRLDDLVAGLDVGGLAELALAGDPSRFGPVVVRLDEGLVAAVATDLLGRDEHAATARFAGALTDDQLRAALGAATETDLAAVVPHLAPAQADRLAGLRSSSSRRPSRA